METSQILVDILRYDKKTTSYKMALLRAINEILFLEHDHITSIDDYIAISIEDLARLWIAYYWPFMNQEQPILQGRRASKNGIAAQDISFRFSLTFLKQRVTETSSHLAQSDGGYHFIQQEPTNSPIISSFDMALKDIQKAILMPIRYAGKGGWSVFAKPQKFPEHPPKTRFLHTPRPGQHFLILSRDLCKTFYELSYLLEAFCVHEWTIFTQQSNQSLTRPDAKSQIYRMLSGQPGNRLPETWELLCAELEDEGDQTHSTNFTHPNSDTTSSNPEKGIRESYLSYTSGYLEKSVTDSVLLESRQQKVAAAAESELKAHGQPLHYTIITRMVLDRYPEIKVSDRQMLYTLRRQSQKFSCVYDGTFQIV